MILEYRYVNRWIKNKLEALKLPWVQWAHGQRVGSTNWNLRWASDPLNSSFWTTSTGRWGNFWWCRHWISDESSRTTYVVPMSPLQIPWQKKPESSNCQWWHPFVTYTVTPSLRLFAGLLSKNKLQSEKNRSNRPSNHPMVLWWLVYRCRL